MLNLKNFNGTFRADETAVVSFSDDERYAHHDTSERNIGTFTMGQESGDEYLRRVVIDETANTDIELCLKFIDNRLARSDSTRVVVGVDVDVNVADVTHEIFKQRFEIKTEGFHVAGKTGEGGSVVLDDTHYLVDGSQLVNSLAEPRSTE